MAQHLEPSAAHPITITPNANRVRVTLGGQVIADTTHALTLNEATLPAVHYIPREDARMEHFVPTATSTHCPFKGDASYFTVTAGGRSAQDAVWSYPHPYPAVSQIAGHLAFYPNRVDAIEETDAA